LELIAVDQLMVGRFFYFGLGRAEGLMVSRGLNKVNSIYPHQSIIYLFSLLLLSRQVASLGTADNADHSENRGGY
jgi:hypothetical protein